MNTKKIIFSLIASALLTTASYATAGVGSGKLNLSGGSGAITTEYGMKYGAVQALDLGNLRYTANILGSGSVSDALIRLDLTDTNLSSTDNANFVSGETVLVNESNETIATYDKKVTLSDGHTYFLFDGDATKSIVDGIVYRIAESKDNNDSVSNTYSFNTGKNELQLNVYSTSGTEEERDLAKGIVTTSESAQFSSSCVSKYNGLINFEDFRQSFVSTSHDNVVGDTSDGYATGDTMVFTLSNNRGTGLYLEGNATTITFHSTNIDGTVVNTDNNFTSAASGWTGLIFGVKPDGTRTEDGNFTYTTDGNLTFTLSATEAIVPGTTTYYATLDSNGSVGISPVYFTGAQINIEGGLVDGNDTNIQPMANQNPTEKIDLGAWHNHAYIGQIPAVTNDANVKSKIFVVNRSCAVAKPEFRFIKDGVVTSVEGTTIAVNAQNVYKVTDLLKAANLVDGRYAVEVVLPGTAEDFYVHAQAKGTSGFFKDLPVYNTSSRN